MSIPSNGSAAMSHDRHHRDKKLYCHLAYYLAVVVALIALVVSGYSLKALEQPGNVLAGANIVFVIDQSGSMGGSEYGSKLHPVGNDQDGRRFEVARFATNFLGELRYTYAPRSDRDWDIRVSVVYFGSSPEPSGSTETPLSNLVIDPDTEEQWRPVQAEAETVLSPQYFGKRNLNGTDFRKAFEEALLELNAMDAASADPNRLRAIILVTDGRPSVVTGVDSGGSFVYDRDWQRNINGVRTLLVSDFSNPNDRLFVIGLNDTEPYWPLVRNYWENMTTGRGFAELVGRNDDVTAYVQRAINEIIAPFACVNPDDPGCVVPVDDTVKVLPYLRQITFIIHKVRINDEITFINQGQTIDLDGQSITRTNRDKLVETITMRNPPPGMWDVQRLEGSDIKVFKYDLLEPIFSLDLPSGRDQLGCGRPSTLQLKFRGPGDVPIREYDGYPLDLTMEIRWPSVAETFTNWGTQKAAGMYEQRAFIDGFGNDAEIWLLATTKDPENLPLKLFDGSLGKLSVPQCTCKWLTPPPVTLSQYDTTNVSVQWVSGSSPIDLTVDGEYEVTSAFSVQGRGISAPPMPQVASDARSISVTLNSQVCSDVTVGTTLTLRDVQNGQTRTLCTLPEQLVVVNCATLVRMIVDPSSSLARVAACDLWGNPIDLHWKTHLEDEQGNRLSGQQVLAQPGRLPFSETISDSDGTSRGTSSWTPLSLPPSLSDDYVWTMATLPTGVYTATLDFDGQLAPNYIRDPSYTHYQTTLSLVTPGNLVQARAGYSALGLLLLPLVGLVYLVAVQPRLGPRPQESLMLEKQNMGQFSALLGKCSMSLLPQKKQRMRSTDYPALAEYADELIVRQDPDDWQVIWVTPIVAGQKHAEQKLAMGQQITLENRESNNLPATLRYDVKNFQEVEQMAQGKKKSDWRKRAVITATAIVLAALAVTAIWFLLPLGC
jgi:hypothetical protein